MMVDEAGEPAGSRFSRAPDTRVLVVVGGVLIALAVVVVAVIRADRPGAGDPGRLSERVLPLPAGIALPVLADVTAEWGLDGIGLVPTTDAMAGGSATADVDGDGTNELVVANGSVAILRWNGDGYGDPRFVDIGDAIGVSAADADGDGFDDILVARVGDTDSVIWGGPWLVDGTEPDMTSLPGVGQSSALLAGELSGDSTIDIVRLGRGKETPAPDILWTAVDDRGFEPTELPRPNRFSLAGELVDADNDGLLDIWITRDVGWDQGGDSVLSRRGDPTGEWTDIAAELGVDLEVDGMGVTVADFDRNGELDAYVSDLGDNEMLVAVDGEFSRRFDSGAAHIRPQGTADGVVSSTWGTGALDINLDGHVDLVLASGGFPEGAVRNKIEDTEVAVAEAPAVLVGHGDGNFTNVWEALGIEFEVVGRGLTVADLDDDGDDDIVIVDRRGPVWVLRNDTTGPSIAVSLPSGCADHAGLDVSVVGTNTSFYGLLAPHGYASSHGAAMIVGVPSGAITVTSRASNHETVIERVAQRVTLALDCG